MDMVRSFAIYSVLNLLSRLLQRNMGNALSKYRYLTIYARYVK